MSLAQRELSDFWSTLPLGGDPTVVRDLVLDFYPDLVAVYGDTAAVIGADFYDALRDAPPSAGSFQAAIGRPAGAEQAIAAARWGLGPLFTAAEAAGSLELLAGAAQRLIMQPARDSIYEAARQDPAGVGFARVPVGPTCKWCTMIASRGFVYGSRASAGESNRWHDHCNCAIVPGRSDGDYPDGHDVAEYRRLYRAGEGIPAN